MEVSFLSHVFGFDYTAFQVRISVWNEENVSYFIQYSVSCSQGILSTILNSFVFYLHAAYHVLIGGFAILLMGI